MYDFLKPPEDLDKRILLASEYLVLGEFETACREFQNLIKSGGDNLAIDTGLKCSSYWKNRIKNIEKMKNSLLRGKYLLGEWEEFKKFLKQGIVETNDYD